MLDKARRSRSPIQARAGDDIFHKLKNILGEKHLIKNDELQGYDALNKLLGKKKEVGPLSFKRRNQEDKQIGYRRINSHNQLGLQYNTSLKFKRKNKPLVDLKSKYASKKEPFGLSTSKYEHSRRNSSKSIERAKWILSQKQGELIKANKGKKKISDSEVKARLHPTRYNQMNIPKNQNTSNINRRAYDRSKFNTLKSEIKASKHSHKKSSGQFRDVLLEILNRRKSSGKIDINENQLQDMFVDDREQDKDSETGELDKIKSQISEAVESEDEQNAFININESVRNIFKRSQESDSGLQRKTSEDTLKKQWLDSGAENTPHNDQVQAYSYNRRMIDSEEASEEENEKQLLRTKVERKEPKLVPQLGCMEFDWRDESSQYLPQVPRMWYSLGSH